MAGNQQARDVESADATSVVVTRQNCFSEEGLTESLHPSYRSFCLPVIDIVRLENLWAFYGVRVQLAQNGVSDLNQTLPTPVELIPNRAILMTHMDQSGDAPTLQERIERPEIAEFSRHRTRSPSDDLSKVNHLRVIRFCLRKRNLAIEVQREN